MPKGTWGEFQWHVKVSPESEKKGMLRGWVDGKLRWSYENIATIQSGSYASLSIHPTFNQRIELCGPRLLAGTPIAGGADGAIPESTEVGPVGGRELVDRTIASNPSA
jgi:hypothetical protein